MIVGVIKTGHKEFVAIEEGLRESELSWLEVLNNLKNRGLSIGPELAGGDGSLGTRLLESSVEDLQQHQAAAMLDAQTESK